MTRTVKLSGHTWEQNPDDLSWSLQGNDWWEQPRIWPDASAGSMMALALDRIAELEGST